MLVDEVIITVRAGHGGTGRVAFHKVPGMLGPTGGNGGTGGNVYVEGVSDLGVMRRFRHQKKFEAENGEDGGINLKAGHTGADLILQVPVGTIITNAEDGADLTKTKEVVAVGERILLAKGGPGGKGNFEFRSSTNTTPLYSQNGVPGETFTLKLELQLIAEAGLIGLPNAGKSSLLTELTLARPRIGSYPFTTLEPNLGAYIPEAGPRYGEQIIIADIPGLIEGAAKGKGLGIKFLRHVRRTKFFLHCISLESKAVVSDYKTVRKELGAYDKALLEKKEYILLTKTDLVGVKEIEAAKKKLEKYAPVFPVSIHDEDSLLRVQKMLEGVEK